jgi:hypothetical protein
MTIGNCSATGSLTGKKVQRVTSIGADASATMKALIERHMVYWKVKTQAKSAAKDMVWYREGRPFGVRDSGEPRRGTKRF